MKGPGRYHPGGFAAADSAGTSAEALQKTAEEGHRSSFRVGKGPRICPVDRSTRRLVGIYPRDGRGDFEPGRKHTFSVSQMGMAGHISNSHIKKWYFLLKAVCVGECSGLCGGMPVIFMCNCWSLIPCTVSPRAGQFTEHLLLYIQVSGEKKQRCSEINAPALPYKCVAPMPDLKATIMPKPV